MNTHLTKTERAILEVLTAADRPMPFRNLYAYATNTPVLGAAGSTHICNLRKKGVRIGHKRGVGYWLEERGIVPHPAERPRVRRSRRRDHSIPTAPYLAALELKYAEMAGRERAA